MSESKCWTCTKSDTNGCSWAKEYKPIKNWVINKKTIIDCGGNKELILVAECPEYEKEPPRKIIKYVTPKYTEEELKQKIYYGILKKREKKRKEEELIKIIENKQELEAKRYKEQKEIDSIMDLFDKNINIFEISRLLKIKKDDILEIIKKEYKKRKGKNNVSDT